jgi:hypothetical protein
MAQVTYKKRRFFLTLRAHSAPRGLSTFIIDSLDLPWDIVSMYPKPIPFPAE